jgi:hypothetical protein
LFLFSKWRNIYITFQFIQIKNCNLEVWLWDCFDSQLEKRVHNISKNSIS